MLESARIIDLAEAVADGRIPDWSAAESGTADAVERGVIAKLRAVHAIHGLMTTWTARSGDAARRVVLAPGDTWGGLEIRGHIGRGKFGDVYRAWDPALDRDVALKLIRHGDGADMPESRVVFEGRLMARVRHPNVVTIHGAQRIDGVSGLWMELVGGRTLAAELAERGPFDANELMRVGAELARALDAVHRAGLVHRDVKAQNVLREASGRILLGDFGTGLELDEPDEDRGGLAGTPAVPGTRRSSRASRRRRRVTCTAWARCCSIWRPGSTSCQGGRFASCETHTRSEHGDRSTLSAPTCRRRYGARSRARSIQLPRDVSKAAPPWRRPSSTRRLRAAR